MVLPAMVRVSHERRWQQCGCNSVCEDGARFLKGWAAAEGPPADDSLWCLFCVPWPCPLAACPWRLLTPHHHHAQISNHEMAEYGKRVSSIIFFLHIPFPTSQIFRALAYGEDLLNVRPQASLCVHRIAHQYT